MKTGSAARAETWAARALMRGLLLLIVLRAVIPIGFMPDSGALRDGRIEIVICTPTGLKAVTVDAAGEPVEEGEGDRQTLSDCPFQSAISKALIEPAALGEPARLTAAVETLAPALDRVLAAPAQGPPLGSRAPPHHLG